jgi:hypothetical protein
MLITMWSVGLGTTIPQLVGPPPYLFSAMATALLYLSGAVGGFIGGVWGHVFNDFLTNLYLSRHHGRWLPEYRLWALYPATAVGVAALVLIGQSLSRSLPWIALAVGWAMYMAAGISATTVIGAYVLDCCPRHAALVSSIANFWRTTGVFHHFSPVLNLCSVSENRTDR